MSSINLYKIDNSKIDVFSRELSSKMKLTKTIIINKEANDEDVEYGFTLYFSRPKPQKELKWNWLLELFDESGINVNASPSAVLLVEKGEDAVYAITFGHSFFLVDKYAEKDFGFAFARKIRFDEIKTTTLTTPNSRRNKMVSTYVNYDELEFDSGESFAKLKAKTTLEDEFSLFKPSLEIGTSIRLITEDNTLERIVDIISYIENVISTEEDKYKIPVFMKIKDQEQIDRLNERMKNSVNDNPNISISELDIIGATEVFNRNDSEFILKYKRKEKHVVSLSNDELRTFCSENNFDFGETVLDITVCNLIDGNSVGDSRVRDLVDYTDDEERCLLSKGIWYQYNDDYLNYLRDSINEIKAEYHPEYDFNDRIHDNFVSTYLDDARNDPDNAGKIDAEIIKKLKKTYYAERAFNMIMERDHSFENFDREENSVCGAKVEIMDLYKDKTMYAVKIGNSSAKLCYAVDQSISSLKLYKHRLLEGMPEIDTVAIWLVLDHRNHIEDNGVPDINALNMLMLKNRLDYWKKEVRLQGFKPLIYINYRS